MHKHTSRRPNGFAKYRNRQKSAASPLFRSLPASRQRALRRNLIFIGTTLGGILLLSLLSRAFAAGGPYVVDDGAINAPGECNLDAWYTRNRHDSSTHHTTLSAACTPKALPRVQWAAVIEDDETETQVSPQFKASLWSWPDAGIEIAIAGATHVAVHRRHAFEGAELGVPLTWQPRDALRLNVNAGWAHAYDDGEQNQRLAWGVGFEYSVADSMTWVAERYGRQHGDQAWQTGPRLHVGKRLDVDLVIGRSLVEDRDPWLTTGATLRF
ncbi:hypothetical protein [Pseudomonas mucidolens]|uniref:Uncharacterized protein n=1 Tax=Pseudomonas mucidolens TaxID=46679 RepID=A0A1H2MTK4_9PSED|nr:hypothetical protein [Pseudomonas mucidolens]SDU96434.1 hypothetical protein SAMN05216202_2342 [Pseudomonas mucidolens]SQH33265.1 Uncharacterised protein [Pseudomonas mucidolens]